MDDRAPALAGADAGEAAPDHPARLRQRERAADWEANKAFTYQVQREDLEIYRAIQLGVHSGANAEHCFGSQESALAQFNANVERFPERSG